eukprot:CAMPEP_0118898436 /NCGR_PEP_ID=MMETSP1166-20130328/5428_1 /TAXON_ID=1104430 /ORGANISM="Chrysoreinhardia sp, Strain CCMP3193" /LENGTH=795 /DNA_ID=CAMNT_0006837545 /DNA_START=9 /DNA_END=2396 /DNA_ORIENTATION=+
MAIIEEAPAALMSQKRRALPLVSLTEDASALNGWRLETHAEALDVLRSIESHVVVVAVAGPYRTGKSSLLNWLLGSSVVQVGHEVERCTKGVWLCEPVVDESGDRPAAFVALDTEGLGGLADVDAAYDATLFTLAALLSSTLIYNSQGALDERAITNLGFVANLSRQILNGDGSSSGQTKSEERRRRDDSSSESSSPPPAEWMPKLAWLLRDFALELVDEEGRPLTSNEYLERAMKEPAKSCFPDRECWTLPHPFVSPGEEGVRPEFLEGLSAFRRAVLASPPKKIQGAPATGRSFARLVEEYAKVLSSPLVPELSSAWRRVFLDEIADLSKRANDVHSSELKGTTLSLTALARAHARGARRGEDVLRSDLVVSNRAALDETLTKFRADCDARFEDAVDEFHRSASAAVKKRVDDANAKVIAPFLEDESRTARDLGGGEKSLLLGDSLGGDLDAAKQKIDALARGVLLVDDDEERPHDDNSSSPEGEAPSASASSAPPASSASQRAVKFAVEASFAVSKAVAELSLDAKEALVQHLSEKASDAEKQLAFFRGKDLARDDAAEQNRRESHAKTRESLELKAKVEALEFALTAEREKSTDLVKTADDARQELADVSRALDNEHKWQLQLQERLDLRIQLAKEREEDLASRLKRAHRRRGSSHSKQQRHVSFAPGTLTDEDSRRAQPPPPPNGRSGVYTVLDFLLDDTRDAASKLDVDAEELERFCLDIDLLTILPSLKKLGASSVADLIFLEPADLDDFKELDTLQKRRLLDAVQTAKLRYSETDPLHPEAPQCALS